MKQFLPVLALLLSACFGQGNYLPEPSPIGAPGAKRVSQLFDLSVPFRLSRYARVTDPIEISESRTIRLALAGDGTACPIPTESPWWVSAKPGINLPCPAGWRVAR